MVRNSSVINADGWSVIRSSGTGRYRNPFSALNVHCIAEAVYEPTPVDTPIAFVMDVPAIRVAGPPCLSDTLSATFGNVVLVERLTSISASCCDVSLVCCPTSIRRISIPVVAGVASWAKGTAVIADTLLIINEYGRLVIIFTYILYTALADVLEI